jgi:hypothetical protein
MNEHSIIQRIKGWQALILAILPFYGYLLAFGYEGGYVSYFDVPEFLIKVTISQVIESTVILLAGCVVVFVIVVLQGYPLFKSWRSSSVDFYISLGLLSF